jgi:hypothetical protein
MPEGGVTPRALFSRFKALHPKQREEFIQLVGSESTTDLFGAFWNALPMQERSPFLLQVIAHIRPVLIREAIPLVKAFPELSVEEQVELISKAYEKSTTDFEAGIVSREQQRFRAKRNRKASLATIRRNVEMCDLRGQDPEKWYPKSLARRFGVSDAYVRRVLKQESMWRQLAAQNRTN